MEVDAAVLVDWLARVMWPFARLGGFLMTMPVIGAATVPRRVRVLLAFTAALALAGVVPPPPALSPFSLPGLLGLAEQALLGALLGAAFQIFLHMFSLAGQFVAMQMGLGFASMMDPSAGSTSTVLGQLHVLLVTLLFLAVDGHLLAIGTFVEWYQRWPTLLGPGPEGLAVLLGLGTWLFDAAVRLALPLVGSLLVVNLAFGMIARVAPQLNIFSIGFPFMLLMGLVLLVLHVQIVIDGFERELDAFGLRLS